jgi:hypothetical protein
MKFTLVAAMVMTSIAVILVFLVPAIAQEVESTTAAATAVAQCVPVAGGIDFCPLVPVVNGFINTIAGLIAAAIPFLATYLVIMLRNHGISLKANAQKVIADRIGATVQNGLKYATSGADAGIEKLTVPVNDPALRTAANYVILQSPDLLKKAGIDVTTEAGQQQLIRRIIAEAQPTPAALAPSSTLNVTTDKPQPVAGQS